MGKIIHISVRDKVALYSARDGAIICGNDDYQVQFALDPEWDGVPAKARFIWNGQYEDAPIVDGIAKVPRIIRAHEVRVGVYSEDESLQTTTAARVPCSRSILCDTAEPTEDNEAFYASEAQEAADRAEAAADRAEAVDKVDKSYIISVFGELKTALENSDIDGAIAVLDQAILDMATLA